MKCHCDEGTYNNLNAAIYNSCNTYFAKVYKETVDNQTSSKIGLDKWKEYVNSFGMGNYLGYDHPTGRPGFIPSSNYYDRWYNKSWRASTTISNSIGQGEILSTPIQMANLAATIANKGWYIAPHFVKEIENDSIDSKFKEVKRTLIDEKYYDPIIKGMIDVVEKGTATNSKIKDILIAGKTGTAENFIKIDAYHIWTIIYVTAIIVIRNFAGSGNCWITGSPYQLHAYAHTDAWHFCTNQR